jgi:histidine triad (HIT) family protein
LKGYLQVDILEIMVEECLFCKIASGKLDKKFEKETENVVVFKDVNPQAAIHLLVVPKKHIGDISELSGDLMREIRDVVVGITRARSLKGYRLVFNAGDAAMISHIHIHLLGDVTSDRAV